MGSLYAAIRYAAAGSIREAITRVGFANLGGLVFVDESAEEVATA
jgi:hypothetical protein